MKKVLCLLFAAVMLFSVAGCSFDATDYLASITYTDAPSLEPTAAPTPDSGRPDDARATAEPTVGPSLAPLPEGVSADISAYARDKVYRASLIMDAVISYITAHPIEDDSSVHPFAGANLFAELTYEQLALYENMLLSALNFTRYSVTCRPETMDAALTALLADHPEIEVYFTMVEGSGSSRRNTSTGRENGGLGGNNGGGNSGSGNGGSGNGGSGNGGSSGGSIGGSDNGGTGKTNDHGGTVAEGTTYTSVFFLPDGRYFGPATNVNEVRDEVEAFTVTASYVAGRIPEDFSAIDKYRALAYYISANSQYAYVENEEVPRYATNAFGAIINGYSICQGYTIGFEYLCRVADLDCVRLTNGADDENLHYWDIITLDGGTYYVDVTWSDGSVYDYSDPNWFRWFVFPEEYQHVANNGVVATGEALDKTGWR